MKIDASTPCPACPILVRAVVESAGVLVLMLEHRQEQVGDVSRGVLESTKSLKTALQHLQKWVDAHHANRLHALSPELADARNPVLEERALSTSEDDRATVTYVIWSVEHEGWWRPHGWGYSDTLREAGLFDTGDPEVRGWIERAQRGELRSIFIPVSALAGVRHVIERLVPPPTEERS